MISEGEWTSIRSLVDRIIAAKMPGVHGYFITGLVVKRDEVNGLVWISELADQGIPIVGFDHEVVIYTPSGGGVTKETHVAKPLVPQIGEAVLVALEDGEQNLPRCLGIVQGKNWMVMEDES